MKQSPIRARSTEGTEAVLGFLLVVVVNIIMIMHPWHFIKTKWPVLQVIETIAGIVGAIFVICLLGWFFREIIDGFWPVMYSLVNWHRKRAEKQSEKSKPAPKDWPPTLFDNLRSDLNIGARWMLWGALAVGIIWGIRSCGKAIFVPDNHPPAYSDPNE